MQRLRRVNTMRATGILLMAFAIVVYAQGLKTTQEIEGFSTAKMSAYKSWSADYSQTMNVMGSRVAMTGQVVQKPPRRVWMQLDMPIMGQQTKMTMTMGQDGVMWQVVQMGGQNQIVKMDMNKISSNTFAQVGLSGNPLDQFDPSKQWEIAKAMCDFTTVKGEQLEGQPMYVLEGTWKQAALTNEELAAVAATTGKMRVFVGQNDGFTHRMEHYDKSKTNLVMAMEFKNMKFNQDVPDSTFVYHPPAGAQIMDMTPMVEMQLRARNKAPTPAPTPPAPAPTPATP